MSPKLKGVLARTSLVGGVALVASIVARGAPHDQIIAVRLHGRELSHIEGVVTRQGDDEPTAGFSRDFAPDESAPSKVQHRFSAPNGTYIVVITLRPREPSLPAPEQPHAEVTTREPELSQAGRMAAEQAQARAGAPALRLPRSSSPIPTETSFQRQVSLVGGEVIVSPD